MLDWGDIGWGPIGEESDSRGERRAGVVGGSIC